MTDQNPSHIKYIDFKLNDPFKAHNTVNVAGNFNDWNPTIDSLTFDDDSKNWVLQLNLQNSNLQVNSKVIYKYVVDQDKWICDYSAPLEKDDMGNENNLTFVMSKSISINNNNIDNDNDNDKTASLDLEQTPLADPIPDIVPAAVVSDDETEEVEDFDHKSFHENELFDAQEQGLDETAPTSGEENNHEIEIENSQLTKPLNNNNSNDDANNNSNEIPNPNTTKFTFKSFWESFTWFFKYYILAWFYPQNSTST